VLWFRQGENAGHFEGIDERQPFLGLVLTSATQHGCPEEPGLAVVVRRQRGVRAGQFEVAEAFVHGARFGAVRGEGCRSDEVQCCQGFDQLGGELAPFPVVGQQGFGFRFQEAAKFEEFRLLGIGEQGFEVHGIALTVEAVSGSCCRGERGFVGGGGHRVSFCIPS
jgi:hypothetical protein